MTENKIPLLTLTRARELAAGSIESVRELGVLVFEAVHGAADDSTAFASIVWRPSEHSQGAEAFDLPKLPGCWEWHDLEGNCVLYCDPPGTCSSCGDAPGTNQPIALKA